MARPETRIASAEALRRAARVTWAGGLVAAGFLLILLVSGLSP